MKAFILKVKEWFVWLVSRRVGEAIYEEVMMIVREEAAR